MKIRLEVGPDADVDVQTDKTTGKVTSVTFNPAFVKKNGTATIAFGNAVTDGGATIEDFSLQVSGATGKLTKMGRTETVVAAIDEVKKPGASDES